MAGREDRLAVGVLFGGLGEEHDVSVKSAREVARSLDADRYRVHWVGITRDGRWRLCDGPDGDWSGPGSRPAFVAPDRGVGGLVVPSGDGVSTVHLDLVLPVLHGRLGEDGAVQGLLELAGIPYAGCDVPSSVACMDKALAYTLVRAAGIATPDFRVVPSGDPSGDLSGEELDPAALTYPVFVKPARSGSSFGVTKVAGPGELAAALATARAYDAKVLVEGAVAGSEIGCAVLGDGADLLVGEVDRVALSHGFFRIHQEAAPETGSENATFVVPADIPAADRQRVQEVAVAVYRALGCSGLARVDLFLTPGGEVVLNEVNTMPGLTSYSRYPRMMAAAGLPLSAVLDRRGGLTQGPAGR